MRRFLSNYFYLVLAAACGQCLSLSDPKLDCFWRWATIRSSNAHAHCEIGKMADVEDERYEDDETSDFAHDVEEQSANNNHSQGEEPTAGDSNQLELQQQPVDVDTVGDSDQRFDADAPSPALHPPGETPESTDQNTVSEQSVEKNNVSKDGDDEKFSQPGVSNLDRYGIIGHA